MTGTTMLQGPRRRRCKPIGRDPAAANTKVSAIPTSNRFFPFFDFDLAGGGSAPANRRNSGGVGAMARTLSENDVTSMVIALIVEAESNLETNHATSKACLVRAQALLGMQRYASEASTCCLGRGGLAPWQKQRVQTFIETHLSSRIEMSNLTSIARLSTSHFARAFKKSFGAAPFAYIAQARIALAKRLMLETNLSLSQIALECGMCDQSHFTRVFSRVVSQSPNNWRRAHANGDALGRPLRLPAMEPRHAMA